jgi:hypothetical protein
VNLSVVWFFAGVMIGGLVLGALLVLIRPRDEEAAALYRREAREAQVWLQGRARSVVNGMPSKPERVSRR